MKWLTYVLAFCLLMSSSLAFIDPTWATYGPGYLASTGDVFANYAGSGTINLSSRAMADVCPAGQVVMNSTISGVQCVALTVGTGGNPFDQVLNKSSAVTFSLVNISQDVSPGIRFNDTRANMSYLFQTSTSGTLFNFATPGGAIVIQMDNTGSGVNLQNPVGTASYNGAFALVLKAASAQQANILEIRNSTGTVLVSVVANGSVNATQGVCLSDSCRTTWPSYTAGLGLNLTSTTFNLNLTYLLTQVYSIAQVDTSVGNLAANITNEDVSWKNSNTTQALQIASVNTTEFSDNSTQSGLINAGFTNDSTISTRENSDNTTQAIQIATLNNTEIGDNNTQAALINSKVTSLSNKTTTLSSTNTTSSVAWQLVPNFSLTLAAATTYKVNCEFKTETNFSTSGSQVNVSFTGFGFNITQWCVDYPTATTLFTFESNFTNSPVNTFACLSTGNPTAFIPKTIIYDAVIQTNASTVLNWSIRCETGVCNVKTDPLSYCTAQII